MSGVAWPELDTDKANAAELRAWRGDLSTYTDAQLVQRARLVQVQLPHLFSQHVISGSSAAVAPGLLGVVAEAIGEPSLPMSLLSSIGDVDSADANYALWNLSRMVHNDAQLTAAFDAGLNDVLSRVTPRSWLHGMNSWLSSEVVDQMSGTCVHRLGKRIHNFYLLP